VKVKVTREADEQARFMGRWWRAHRKKSPQLFAEEFRSAKLLLAEDPYAGTEYVNDEVPGVWRLLMPGTRNHIYYQVDPADQIVVIIALWGAPKGSAPPLK
jgi:hypothetical protein